VQVASQSSRSILKSPIDIPMPLSVQVTGRWHGLNFKLEKARGTRSFRKADCIVLAAAQQNISATVVQLLLPVVDRRSASRM
jgi:hypothetical protein